MAGEWQRCAVADLITQHVLLIGDGYRAKNKELGARGLPFARAGNINGGFQFEDTDRFPLENLGKVGFKASQPNDIVFTSKGTVGRFAFVREDTERFVYSPQLSFWRVLDSRVIDPRFLYFWMFGREFYAQFSSVKGQTDMADYVSLRDQRQMYITLPPLAIQRRIAEILGALDDKIEVNRRINATLEAMAQALYKHWFVDFGPFQDGEFVESEVGLIPEGWAVTNIGSVCEVVSGATPSTKVPQYWDGDICWATPTDITALTAPVIFDTSRKITQAGLDSCSAALLPPDSVLVTSRATLGVAAINHVPMATNQGFKSLICGPRVTNHFMLLHIKLNQDDLINNANGSTFLEINSKNFRALPLLVPESRVMRDFERIVEPYFDQIYVHELESSKLVATRDYLLPKLLSGEIPVEAAEVLMSR